MKTKFQPKFYVIVYELARDGLPEEQMAQIIGVSRRTFLDWKKEVPAFQDALDRGRKRRNPDGATNFKEYIYNHLDPELQRVWNQINAVADTESGVDQVKLILAGQGKTAKQHLFLYALTQSMFNVSQSLRRIGLTRKDLEHWIQRDPDFATLMQEIHWHKQNFFETAFIGRVQSGDTAAILHAVKTQCKDRGYNDKIEIEHTGTIRAEHTINTADLDLDPETRLKIIEAIKKKQATNNGKSE